MAAAGTIRAQGPINGYLTGQSQLDLAWVLATAVPVHSTLTLVADTPAQLAVLPKGASVAFLCPPAGNTTRWALSVDGVAFLDNHLTFPVVLTANTNQNPNGTSWFVKSFAAPLTLELRAF